jgi:hypothetical protein
MNNLFKEILEISEISGIEVSESNNNNNIKVSANNMEDDDKLKIVEVKNLNLMKYDKTNKYNLKSVYNLTYRSIFENDSRASVFKNVPEKALKLDKEYIAEYFKINSKSENIIPETFKIYFNDSSFNIGYIYYDYGKIHWAKLNIKEIESIKKSITDLKVTDEKTRLKSLQDAELKEYTSKIGSLKRMGFFVKNFITGASKKRTANIKKDVENFIEKNMDIGSFWDIFSYDYVYLGLFDALVDITSYRSFSLMTGDLNVNMYTDMPNFVYTKYSNPIKYYNSITDNTYIEKDNLIIYFLKTRCVYSDWFNSVILDNKKMLQKGQESFEVFKTKDAYKENPKYYNDLFDYYHEPSLSLNDLCNYFKLDIDLVLKLYVSKYFLDVSNVLKDFFDGTGEYYLSQYINTNITIFKNYLYTEYEIENDFDKHLICLVCYIYKVSRTGLYLLLSYIRDRKKLVSDNFMNESNEVFSNYYRDYFVDKLVKIYPKDPETSIAKVKIPYSSVPTELMTIENRQFKEISIAPPTTNLTLSSKNYKSKFEDTKVKEIVPYDSYLYKILQQKEELVKNFYGQVYGNNWFEKNEFYDEGKFSEAFERYTAEQNKSNFINNIK